MKYVYITCFFLCTACLSSAQNQMQVKKNDYHTFLTHQKNISPELNSHTSAKNKQHPEFGVLPYNASCKDCYEELDKRTIDSRYFVKNNTQGKEFYIQKANGPINYLDDDGFMKAIDWNLYPTAEAGIYTAPSQSLPTKVDMDNGFTSITLADKFEFKYNTTSLNVFYTYKDIERSAPQKFIYGDYTAGKDGVYITNAFNKIDCEIAVRQGAIKTNFIIKDKSVIDPLSEYLIIEDRLEIPAGYALKEDPEHGYFLKDGSWKGDINLYNEASLKLLKIERPIILDNHNEKYHDTEQYEAVSYSLIPDKNNHYILQIRVKTKWLLSDDRKYPVIVDPTLIGEAAYTASDIGFEFNSVCFDLTDYCNYFLDVVVPGKTTLTAAYFDGTYYSQNFGCFFTTDCLMKEAAFTILGPCDDSPATGSFWSCLPPAGDTAGTCYGIDLDMFNTIACIPPQCEDYLFTFEMRTYMCSCTKPPCDITCHYMPAGSWVITIEGKTVEETAIESDLHPDFTICAGDSIDLSAGGEWGVPPYTYEWSPTGGTADEVIVSPEDTIMYTSVIHDDCGMLDTVYQIINVIPAPTLSPGPFEGCYTVVADAGAGYSSYLWSTGETTQTVVLDSTGTYFVTVTDGNGCAGLSDPIDVIINVAPEINAFPDTVYISNGELAQLNVETTSTGDVTYDWSPIIDVSCNNCDDPFGIVTDAQETFYVTGEENGCVSDPDTIVVINASTQFIVPNAFSPNGDQLNDIFIVYSELYYPVFQMLIYDRWGELIFEGNDMLDGWDGTYLNADQEVGAYIWVINYEKLNEKGNMYVKKGTVTLLR